jgi:hypothetical protein
MSSFAALLERFAAEGVVESSFFSARGFAVEGKIIGCFMRDIAAFKLGRDTPELADALTIDGASLFDPTLRHRPYKDWVAVPQAHPEHFERLLGQALTRYRA